MSEPSIRRAGITVLAFVIGAKLVGFLREVVVAGVFGASDVVDVYLAAVTVPALINGVLHQALPNAFVPLFAGAHDGRGHSRAIAWGILAAMAGVASALWFFAKPIASLTNAGFATPLQAETVVLVRIVAGSVLLGTIEALARSRLLAHKRFVQTGVSSLWLSLAIIVAVILYPDGGARTLAWGFLAGAACVAVWNSVSFNRGHVRSYGAPGPLGANADSAGGWVLAVLLMNTVSLLYGIIDRYLGSFLAEGSIAVLQYASVVASQPLAVCATALGTAIFPYLSDRLVTGDEAGAAALFDRAVRWALLGAVPAALAVTILGEPIVTVLFERGQFDAQARSVTGMLLSIYGFWIVPAVLASVVGKVFYAGMRWRPIMLAIMVALALKALLSFWWVEQGGVIGLVSSTVVATVASLIVLLAALPSWSTSAFWRSWVRLAVATGAMVAIPFILARLIPLAFPAIPWKTAAAMTVVTGLGGGALLSLWLGPRAGILEIVKIRIAIEALILRRR